MWLVFNILGIVIINTIFTSTSAGILESNYTHPTNIEIDKNRLIIGGEPAEQDELNSLVLIETEVKISGDKYYQRCGGSLISEDLVLTAAHCMINLDENKQPNHKWDKITVLIGSHYIARMEKYVVEWINYHDSFQKETGENDIAVVKLKRPTTLISPIAYANSTYPLIVGATGTIAGWGTLQVSTKDDPHVHSNQLMKANISVFDPKVVTPCKGINSTTQFCAGNATKIKDSCSGDSGGPFIHNGTVYGIVSRSNLNTGVNCDGYGIYTHVSSFADWIKENSNEYNIANNHSANRLVITFAILFLSKTLLIYSTII